MINLTAVSVLMATGTLFCGSQNTGSWLCTEKSGKEDVYQISHTDGLYILKENGKGLPIELEQEGDKLTESILNLKFIVQDGNLQILRDGKPRYKSCKKQ